MGANARALKLMLNDISEIITAPALHTPLWRGETAPINAKRVKTSGVCAGRAGRRILHTPALVTHAYALTHIPLSRGDGYGR
jgi:hypothetical protein